YCRALTRRCRGRTSSGSPLPDRCATPLTILAEAVLMTAVRPMDHHVVDPTGLGVILTEECWLDHITTRHPEMHPFKEMVLETTRAPDAIYVGKRDPSRRSTRGSMPTFQESATSSRSWCSLGMRTDT